MHLEAGTLVWLPRFSMFLFGAENDLGQQCHLVEGPWALPHVSLLHGSFFPSSPLYSRPKRWPKSCSTAAYRWGPPEVTWLSLGSRMADLETACSSDLHMYYHFVGWSCQKSSKMYALDDSNCIRRGLAKKPFFSGMYNVGSVRSFIAPSLISRPMLQIKND